MFASGSSVRTHGGSRPKGRWRRTESLGVVAGAVALTMGLLAPQVGASPASRHSGMPAHAKPFDVVHDAHSATPAAPATQGPATGGRVLYVAGTRGKDHGTCEQKAAPCRTIGYAARVAPARATIIAAGGTYPDQIVVQSGQNLTIVGQGEGSTIIEPTDLTVSDPDPDNPAVPVYAAVDAQPGSTLDMEDLTVNGSAAQDQFTGCGDNFAGVYYHDASGGMKSVAVTDIELPEDLFGCQDGLGVYVASDMGSASRVEMDALQVNNYDKNGITCDDPGTSCTIIASTVTGVGATNLIAQNGIQGYGAANITISKSSVSGNNYTPEEEATGILLIDNAAATVDATDTTGNDSDIYPIQDTSAPSRQSLDIIDNTASDATDGGIGIVGDSLVGGLIGANHAEGDAGAGIALYGVSQMTIAGNVASGDGDGIYLGGPGSYASGSTGDVVWNNQTHSNTDDGVQADTDSSGNWFVSNSATDNGSPAQGTYDFQDSSSGSGTAGTADYWWSDTCQPPLDSYPAGLC